MADTTAIKTAATNETEAKAVATDSPVGVANTTGTTASKTESAKSVGKTDAAANKSAAQPAKPIYPNTLTGAKQAFKDKNFMNALKILFLLEDNYAGRVEYDYLLGRSALETKNFDVAIAAFTRALTVDPQFAAARFELARAYYSKGVLKLARGPFEQARTEFEIVAEMDPPAELRKTIEQYLEYIDKYLQVRETQFSLFINLTGGYDTNIDNTSNKDYQEYYDPTSGTEQVYYIQNNDEKHESGFGKLETGVGITLPLFSSDFEIFGNFLVGGRSHENNHSYDHTWNQVQGGIRHYGESNKKTLRFRFKQTNLADTGEVYHEQGEGMFELAIKHNKNYAYKLWLLGGDSTYFTEGTHVFSVNYNRVGLEAIHLIEGARKQSVQLLLFAGRDEPQNCKNNSYCPDAYARDVRGLRMAYGANIFDTSRFYTSLFYEYSHYDRESLNKQRIDKRIEALVAVNTRFGKHWSIRPEIFYMDNESTHNLFDHDRLVTSITIGWGF